MEITVMAEVRNVTVKVKGSRETGGRTKNSVLWYTRFPSNQLEHCCVCFCPQKLVFFYFYIYYMK
jgi:hypothetical protein